MAKGSILWREAVAFGERAGPRSIGGMESKLARQGKAGATVWQHPSRQELLPGHAPGMDMFATRAASPSPRAAAAPGRGAANVPISSPMRGPSRRANLLHGGYSSAEQAWFDRRGPRSFVRAEGSAKRTIAAPGGRRSAADLFSFSTTGMLQNALIGSGVNVAWGLASGSGVNFGSMAGGALGGIIGGSMGGRYSPGRSGGPGAVFGRSSRVGLRYGPAGVSIGVAGRGQPRVGKVTYGSIGAGLGGMFGGMGGRNLFSNSRRRKNFASLNTYGKVL